MGCTLVSNIYISLLIRYTSHHHLLREVTYELKEKRIKLLLFLLSFFLHSDRRRPIYVIIFRALDSIMMVLESLLEKICLPTHTAIVV